MFNAIGEKTLYVIGVQLRLNLQILMLLHRYIFGIANVITIPMVWALYPETNQRTLEVHLPSVSTIATLLTLHRKLICYSKPTLLGIGMLRSTLPSSRKRTPTLYSLQAVATR